MKRVLYPFLSAWVVMAYIHLIHALHALEFIVWRPLVLALFTPVIYLEWRASRWFDRRRGREAPRRAVLAGRISFWLAVYVFWAVIFAAYARQVKPLQWMAPFPFSSFYLVYRGQGWFTILLFLVWLGSYGALTVRMGRLRIFTAFFLPAAFTFLLTAHLYHFGGIGGMRGIDGQTGVSRFASVTAVGTDRLNHPRGISMSRDGRALFIAFGCSLCPTDMRYTTIIKRPLVGSETHYFMSGNIRRIHVDPRGSGVYAAPWFAGAFFVLDQRDLRVLRKYPLRLENRLLYSREPMDIVKDIEKPRVYIGNNGHQALIAYDLETGEMMGLIDLYNMGLTRWGGPVWNIVQSRKTRRLYFLSGPGSSQLFEVDPDRMTVLRHRGLFDVVGTALAMDEDRGVLYCQKGLFDAILEIDMATLEIRRKLNGEIHARRLRVDPERNRLYVLGYFSGTLFALDLKTGEKIWTRRVGGSPHGMALKGNRIYVNSKAGVIRVNLDTVEASLKAGEN